LKFLDYLGGYSLFKKVCSMEAEVEVLGTSLDMFHCFLSTKYLVLTKQVKGISVLGI
jgi:hypothetical protein